MPLQHLLLRAWQKLLLSGVHYRDQHARLDLFYRMRDPWQLDCTREHFRFTATNAIIQREFGTPAAIVELGCGEGLQSSYLEQICDVLHGIDISPKAISRARARCPRARFQAGDVVTGLRPDVHFDTTLIVACEMIYYVQNVETILDVMSAMGRACLVSYYASHRERLDPILEKKPGLKSDSIRFEDTEWVVSWWRNAPVTLSSHDTHDCSAFNEASKGPF